MTLKEIQNRLIGLKKKGFVSSRRRGPTGIGHTLEQEIHLTESNLAIPDIGGRVELKATRKNSKSMLTLFTFNRAVWKLPKKEIVKNYGYRDEANRQSLYSTIFYNQSNSQGLKVEIDKLSQKVHLYNDLGHLLATWSVYTIIGRFISKLEKLLIVFADSQMNSITTLASYIDISTIKVKIEF